MNVSPIECHDLYQKTTNIRRRNGMKKLLMLAAMMAMVLVTAVPAMAADRDDRQENRLENRLDRFFDQDDESFFFFNPFVDFFFDRDDDFDRDRFDRFDFEDGVVQSNEQEVESGDAEQAFEVTGGGDNSNACQNVQGINNTGNATSNTSVLQVANEDDAEVELEDSGNFEISPETAIECDQQVNQAATASG